MSGLLAEVRRAVRVTVASTPPATQALARNPVVKLSVNYGRPGPFLTPADANAAFAPITHVGSGGTAHALATTSLAGFMSAADKTKINRIVCVEDHGAKADFNLGTRTGFDNTTAFQAAIDAALVFGAVIRFSPGHYYMPSLTPLDPKQGGLVFEGAGLMATFLHVEEGSTGSERYAFRNTADTSKQGLVFRGICFQGTRDVNPRASGANPLYLDHYPFVHIEECRFLEIAGMAMDFHRVDFFKCVNNWFENIGKDSVRARDVASAIVTGNHFYRTGDDCVALHTGYNAAIAADGELLRERLIVANNVMVNTGRGVVLLGAKAATVTGNQMKLVHSIGIEVSTGQAGNEGDNQAHDILIAQNTITDVKLVDASGVIGQPNNYIRVLAAAPRGTAATNGTKPGRYDATSGAFINEYDHNQGQISDAAQAIPPMQGVIIRDNILRRTLKVTAGQTISDWGFGAAMNQGVFYDPVVIDETHTRLAAGIFANTADAMTGVTIAGNIVEHTGSAVYVGGSSADELGLRDSLVTQNTLRDCINYGVLVFPNAAKHTGLTISHNLIDCDPKRKAANSNMDGTYDNNASGQPFGIYYGLAEGLVIEGNRLSNCCNPILGSTPAKNVIRGNTVVMGQPAAFGSFNVGNKGIGIVPNDPEAYTYVIADCDPTSASYGDISHVLLDRAAAMPSSGWYPAGFFVRDTTAATLGWKRLTTGTAHVSGTDWRVIRQDAAPAFVQAAAPSVTGPYLWLQTGLGDGSDFTLWFDDGA